VTAAVVMLGHVFLRRRIAAESNATGLAGTQVYPGTVLLYTFFANVFVANFYFNNGTQVGTWVLFVHINRLCAVS
jgi:hypothetical protein